MIKLIYLFFSNVAGLNTKDIILYSAASGSVIVIAIVAGLCIFYFLRRRRRRQNPPPYNRETTNDEHNSRISDSYAVINDDIELDSHMERENPNDNYLQCVHTNIYETLHSPDINPKSVYSDFNSRRDCMQIPQRNHELKEHLNSTRNNHSNINFETNESDAMGYATATSHPPNRFVVDEDDPYLSVIERSSDSWLINISG